MMFQYNFDTDLNLHNKHLKIKQFHTFFCTGEHINALTLNIQYNVHVHIKMYLKAHIYITYQKNI